MATIAVAEASSYSTSGIPQQLAALERDIGASLLERDGGRLKFTPASTALASEEPQFFDSWERARSRALAATGHIAATLQLGAFQNGLLAIVPELLDTLAVSYPSSMFASRTLNPRPRSPPCTSKSPTRQSSRAIR